MHHPLLQMLSAWCGRQTAQAAFERRGFYVHRLWQERMIAFCGEGSAVDLNRYWDEYAVEVICSAGNADPDARRFMVEPVYRSSYLDELAAKMDFAEPPDRSPPLIKCLYEYYKKSHRDRAFVDSETIFFESAKQEEIKHFAISPAGLESLPDGRLSGWKRDVVPFVERFSAERNFSARRRRFVKSSPSGLIFEIKVDLGGNPMLGRHPPIVYHIYHSADPDFVYEFRTFNLLIPGFSRYEFCPTPASCVLGILAQVEMFDVLFHSFSDAAKRCR